MSFQRNIDLHLLECFTALMRDQSVSRAAERMGLSQSAMSEVLARLRERFDDPLLVRGRRGMQPTPRALALFARIPDLIEELHSLLIDNQTFDPNRCELRFKLVASDYGQLLMMPALVTHLAEEAPAASIDVVPIHIRRVADALETAEADIAIAYFVDPPPGLKRRPLLRETYVAIARRGHPDLRSGLTLATLARLRHVSVAPSGLNFFSGALDQAFARLGLQRRVAVSSPHFLLAANLVAQSDLMLVLPDHAARTLAAQLPVEIFELPMKLRPVQTAMYWHPRVHEHPAHRWLRNVIHRIFQELGTD